MWWRAFWDSALAVVSTQMLIVVWYVDFQWKTSCNFSKVRGNFWKSLLLDLKNITNCPSALQFVPPGCLQKWNLAGKFANFDYACTTTPWISLIAFRCASLCCASQFSFHVLRLYSNTRSYCELCHLDLWPRPFQYPITLSPENTCTLYTRNRYTLNGKCKYTYSLAKEHL